jgi:hypothetical protein
MRLPNPKSYPTELLIAGESWRLAFVDQIEGKDTLGMCDPNNKVIFIKRGLSRKETLKTAIHEVFHALDEEFDLKLSHPQVYKLEEALYDLLVNNF